MKKRLSALISMGLVLSMLAGCGAQDVKESSVAANSSESSAAGESVDKEEADSPYPDYLNLDGYRPIVKEGEDITLTVGVIRGSMNGAAEDSWFARYVEEVLNINLEVIEMTNETLAEKKNLMFASGDLPDMMFFMNISNNEVVQYGVEGGQLLPVSDYINETLTPNLKYTLDTYPEAATMSTAPDGKMYTIASSQRNQPGSGSQLGSSRVFVDTKYMEKVGVTSLPDTLDGWVELLRDFKEVDPENYPVISASGRNYFETFMLYAFGWTVRSKDVVTPVWDMETNSIEVPALTEKYGEYLKVMNTLYTEGILHPDYFTMDETTARSYFTERKAAVLDDGAPYLSMDTGWDEYVAVTPLSSDWCEKGITVACDGVQAGTIFIAADTEYPEVCLRLMDYIYSPEGCTYSNQGPWEGDEEALLGLKGFTASEDGKQVEFPDVADSGYSSQYEWKCSDIQLFYGDTNVAERVAFANEMVGISPTTELKLDHPDDNYRYQMVEAQNDYLVQRIPDLYMSVEQSEKYADLYTVIANYTAAESAKFIVGQRSLDELGTFYEELMEMGGEEYLALCKELYANYER